MSRQQLTAWVDSSWLHESTAWVDSSSWLQESTAWVDSSSWLHESTAWVDSSIGCNSCITFDSSWVGSGRVCVMNVFLSEVKLSKGKWCMYDLMAWRVVAKRASTPDLISGVNWSAECGLYTSGLDTWIHKQDNLFAFFVLRMGHKAAVGLFCCVMYPYVREPSYTYR